MPTCFAIQPQYLTYRWHMTRLVPITHDNWRRAAAVRVADGQLQFVAAYEPVALVLLAKAFVRLGDRNWWPYVIEDAGQVVGVLGLVDDLDSRGELAFVSPTHRCEPAASRVRASCSTACDRARERGG